MTKSSRGLARAGTGTGSAWPVLAAVVGFSQFLFGVQGEGDRDRTRGLILFVLSMPT